VGAHDPYGSCEAYDSFEDRLLQTGVPMDAGMLYADGRLSRGHPRVEVRIADVCMDPRDCITIAALIQALVDTRHSSTWTVCRRSMRRPRCCVSLDGKAAKEGLKADVLHPITLLPVPASTAMHALLEHIQPRLIANHDDDLVNAGVTRLLVEGTGARPSAACIRRRFRRSRDHSGHRRLRACHESRG
jgi:carboxylate-amine ligase